MSLGQELAPHLPFLRRYARALTGSQAHGDAFVRATLETIVASPEEFPREVDPRLGLYRTFHAIWSSANIEEGEEPSMNIDGAEGIAQARLSRITPLSRQALLLTSLEGFSSEDTAYLIAATPDGCRQPGRRGDGRNRAPDPCRRADHRGRADHRDGYRIDRPRPRPQCHRRRGHPRRSGRPGAQVASGPGAGRYPACRRQLAASTRSRTSWPNSRCR